MRILLLIGTILVISFLAGKVFKKIGIPQIVSFIIIGIILGGSFTNILDRTFLDNFAPLTSLALALIGFMVGGELKQSVFKRYGKQFFIILLCEGLTAMLLVSILVIIYTGNIPLGILLGALSSATAPAATVDVLWEYRSKGPLTTTILAIVALDDGLSLILYGFAIAFADLMVTGSMLSWKTMLLKPVTEIILSILIGLATGLFIDNMLKIATTKDGRLIMSLGSIMLAAGIADSLGLSLILTSMAAGLLLTNIHLHRNEAVFEAIKSFAPPIYVLFFIFVGARFQIGLITTMGIIGGLYVFGRTGGKWIGSYFGSRISRAPDTVRKYLGFALFSQAGVAIGLSLDVYQHFQTYGPAGLTLGHTIINVIAATTFLVQIIGPPSVKFAISRAGEIPESVEVKQ